MSHLQQTHRTRQEERNDPKCNWAKSLKCCLWEQAVPSSRDSCQNSKFIRTVSNAHYVLPFWWFSSHTASIGTRPLFHLWGTYCWFVTKLQQGCVKTHQAPRRSITQPRAGSYQPSLLNGRNGGATPLCSSQILSCSTLEHVWDTYFVQEYRGWNTYRVQEHLWDAYYAQEHVGIPTVCKNMNGTPTVYKSLGSERSHRNLQEL